MSQRIVDHNGLSLADEILHYDHGTAVWVGSAFQPALEMSAESADAYGERMAAACVDELVRREALS